MKFGGKEIDAAFIRKLYEDLEKYEHPVEIIHVSDRWQIDEVLIKANGEYVGFTSDNEELLMAWIIQDTVFDNAEAVFSPGRTDRPYHVVARATPKALKQRRSGEMMTEAEIRDLEVRVARALGWKVQGGFVLDTTALLEQPQTESGIPDEVWYQLVPQIARDIQFLPWMLTQLREKFEFMYLIYSDDAEHVVEISDAEVVEAPVWEARDETIPMALCRAIDRCEVVMGEQS